MLRLALAVVAFALFLPAAAEAAVSCSFDAGTRTVTAAFNDSDIGELEVNSGAIEFSDTPCGATTSQAETIVVNGGAGYQVLAVDLSAPFAPGFTDEPGTSDEIEIVANLGAGQDDGPEVQIFPFFSPTGINVAFGGSLLGNLNANEADGVDADLTITEANGSPDVEVTGTDFGDVVSGAGGAGTGAPAPAAVAVLANGGNDQVAGAGFVAPGAGDDTVTCVPTSYLDYGTATGPVTLTLGAGTTPGGDGQGGTDTLTGCRNVNGGGFADDITGDGNANDVRGMAGDDVIEGAGGADALRGMAGDDVLLGGGDDDDLLGGDGVDLLSGQLGDDDLFGDAANDSFFEGADNSVAAETAPNGADDFSGGAGVDTVFYGDLVNTNAGAPIGRTGAVSVDFDGVADDGEAGEGDNALGDVEGAVGGLGNDTLTGDGQTNVLMGFGGADALRGAGGADALLGLGAAPAVDALVADGGDAIDPGSGRDGVDAGEGDDKIAVREGEEDDVICGPGVDTGEADAVDTLAADCEGVARPAVRGGGGGGVVVTPTPSPVVAPPPPRPGAPAALPPLPAIGTLVTQPSARRCVSRRRLRITLKRAVVPQVRGVEVLVNGRRKTRVSGAKLRVPVDLRGLPKGTFRVTLKITLLDGRTVTDTRRYRTCAPRRRG